MPYIPPTKNTERSTKRSEHLKNLIRHSCYSKLIIPNSLLEDKTHGNDTVKQIRKEIKEALEYLKQDDRVGEITLTPYDEYCTIICLKAKEESD